VRAAGVAFGCVLADAGYGMSAAFRHGLSERQLAWAVGIPRTQKVYTTAVRLEWPQTRTGRPRKVPEPSEEPRSADAVLAAAKWRRVAWRHGNEAWLVGEWRDNGERKFHLSNLAPRTSLRALAAAIKARWACEQAHQQLKQEVGLGDFEGRSWTGLHRHALMACIAYAYLQHLRLRNARGRKKTRAAKLTGMLAAPRWRGRRPGHGETECGASERGAFGRDAGACLPTPPDRPGPGRLRLAV
jgi:SRSO17 transposase